VELAGIVAGVLLVRGMPLYGLALYALKIPIAAFTFWLFRVSRERLLRFAWFRWSHGQILIFMEWVKSSEIYRDSIRKFRESKEKLRPLWLRIKRSFAGSRSRWSKRFVRLYLRIRRVMGKE